MSETFKLRAEECQSKTVGDGKTSTDEACACWSDTTLKETFQAVKACRLPDEANEVATALKRCKNKFAECRKYEDEVSVIILACSSSLLPLHRLTNSVE